MRRGYRRAPHSRLWEYNLSYARLWIWFRGCSNFERHFTWREA